MQVLVDNVADSASAVLTFASASDSDSHGSKGGRRCDSVGHVRASITSASSPPSTSASETLEERTGSPCPAERDAASKTLTKDVSQLRRLVQAAITALRNAEIEDQQRTDAFAAATAASVPPAPPTRKAQPEPAAPLPTERTHAMASLKLGRKDRGGSSAEGDDVPAAGGAALFAGTDGSTIKFPAPERARVTTGNEASKRPVEPMGSLLEWQRPGRQ